MKLNKHKKVHIGGEQQQNGNDTTWSFWCTSRTKKGPQIDRTKMVKNDRLALANARRVGTPLPTFPHDQQRHRTLIPSSSPLPAKLSCMVQQCQSSFYLLFPHRFDFFF